MKITSPQGTTNTDIMVYLYMYNYIQHVIDMTQVTVHNWYGTGKSLSKGLLHLGKDTTQYQGLNSHSKHKQEDQKMLFYKNQC